MRRAVFFALLLAACAPRFDVVRAAPKSPLAQTRVVVVSEPQVGDILVNGRPESEYAATLTPAARQFWVSMLEGARGGVLEGLMVGRGDLSFIRSGEGPSIQVALTSVDLAKFESEKVPTTTMHGVVRLLSGGVVRDEVRLTATVEAEVVSREDIEATRARRFHRAASRIGTQAAEYLRYRAGLP